MKSPFATASHMQINSFGTHVLVGQPNTAPSEAAASPNSPRDALREVELRRVLQGSAELRARVEDVEALLDAARISSRNARAALASASELAINLSGTATTLSSSEQVSIDTTSFDPSNPAWTGLSGADPVVGGQYDGAQGTGTLTFTVSQLGVHTLTTARIQVTGPGAELVDEIVVNAGDPIDETYTIANGLTVTFGAGIFVLDDSFTVDVEAAIERTPDPDAAFDGSGGSSPGLDDGLAVIAGTFQVNGTSIDVAANDSITSVLQKISGSGAGVLASYDAGNERVVLTQTTLGPSADIALSGDTSGFLAATKLDTAVAVPGEPSDLQRPIDELPALAGVQAGTFSVNGVDIGLDPASDSLLDVVERINTSEAGASAELVREVYFKIASTVSGTSLTVDSGDTGLFAALNIESQTSSAPRSGLSQTVLQQVSRATDDMFRSFNSLFRRDRNAPQTEELEGLRAQAAAAIDETLDSLQASQIDLGIDFDPDAGTIGFSNDSSRVFRSQLSDRFIEVRQALAGIRNEPGDGLLGRIVASINQTLQSGSGAGVLVDTLA